MEDPVVLSFGDSLIRSSDLTILDSNSWLTDNIISFFFEYFGTVIFSQNERRIAFVGPNFTQLLKLCDKSELNMLVNSAELNDKDYVIFPVNDSMFSDSAGGTHWSLLVCNLRSKWCRHYDSYAGANDENARKLFARLTGCLMDQNSIFEEIHCARQNNGYDCGVYMIVNARILADHLLTDQPLHWLTPSQYSAMRKRFKYVICHANDCVDILS